MAPSKIPSRFAAENRQLLPGSEKAPFHIPAEKPATGKVTVSVVVRRKNEINPKRLGKDRVTRAEYKKKYAADTADLKQIHAFAKEFGLAVEKDTPKPERRTVLLTGTVAAMQKAFGVELKRATVDGATYRVREGGIHLPASLSKIVVAVLGLDNRPQAKPHFRYRDQPSPAGGFRPAAQTTTPSYTPVQVGQLYQFPTTGAAGQTIGIIELGGGFRATDVTAYFKTLGQKTPTVTAVSVDKGKNAPTNANSADGEVMLDIEVAAAVAPGAKIVVYFTPNTDQGFIDAISHCRPRHHQPAQRHLHQLGRPGVELDAAVDVRTGRRLPVRRRAGHLHHGGRRRRRLNRRRHRNRQPRRLPRLQPARPRLRRNQTHRLRLNHHLRGGLERGGLAGGRHRWRRQHRLPAPHLAGELRGAARRDLCRPRRPRRLRRR